MSNVSKNDLKSLFLYCIKIGLCLKCCLRYLAEIYSSSIFINSNHNVQSKINELISFNEQNTNLEEFFFQSKEHALIYCFCCLGILQIGCENDFICSILDKVRLFNYKFKNFQVNLFLPIAVTLRENIINAKLLTKFSHLSFHLKECYTVKDVYRYVLIRKISEISNSRFSIEAKTEINVELSYRDCEIECMELYKNSKEFFICKSGVKFKNVFNHSSITKAIKNFSSKKLINLNIKIPNKCFFLNKVAIFNLPLYLAGRYNKYSRSISQTPWIINNEVKRTSLEEIISKEVVELIPCEKTKFSAAGREDVDVRMLGRGRPFVIEIYNPLNLDIDEKIFRLIENKVSQSSNNLVTVCDLQFTNKDEVGINLKEGESNKIKIYSALCICSREITEKDIIKINQLKNLEINQETPIRVLHRRCFTTRQRIIYNISISNLDDKKKFNLKIETQAGTYIKEFVHGDFGRTNPSLASLLGNCETDIVELDVLEILLDWPPKIR